jgi:hypothetical protein
MGRRWAGAGDGTQKRMWAREKMCPWGWTMVEEEVGPCQDGSPREEMGPGRRWALGGMI